MSEFLFPVAMLFARILGIASRHDQEFLLMSGATWAQLWSGVIGAVFGAVAAAAVASYVLRRTLAAQQALSSEALALQRSLAAEASTKQAELAEQQLREQKSALDAQLAEQRTGLEKQIAAQSRLAQDAQRRQQHQAHVDAVRQQEALSMQLKEQRDEAAKARSYAAISDLVSGVESCVNGFAGGDDNIEGAFLSMRAAVVRWSLDLESDDLRKEIKEWPLAIWHLARLSQVDLARQESGLPNPPIVPFRALASAAGLLTASVQNWPSSSASQQAEILNLLSSERSKVAEAKTSYEAHIKSVTVS